MRHDVAEVDGGEALVVLLQSVEFLGVEGQAGHAGVDVEYCWEFAVGVARVGGPGVEFRERAEDRDNVVGEIVGVRCRVLGRPASASNAPGYEFRGSRVLRRGGRRRSVGSRRCGVLVRWGVRRGRSRRL